MVLVISVVPSVYWPPESTSSRPSAFRAAAAERRVVVDDGAVWPVAGDGRKAQVEAPFLGAAAAFQIVGGRNLRQIHSADALLQPAEESDHGRAVF